MLSEVTEITMKHLSNSVKNKRKAPIQYFSKTYVCTQLAMSVLLILIGTLSRGFRNLCCDTYKFMFVMIVLFLLITSVVNVLNRFVLDNADSNFEFDADKLLIKSFSTLIEVVSFIEYVVFFKYTNPFINVLLLLYHIASIGYITKCLLMDMPDEYEISDIHKTFVSIFLIEISNLVDIVRIYFNPNNGKLKIFVKELPTDSARESVNSISHVIEKFAYSLYKRTPYYYEFAEA